MVKKFGFSFNLVKPKTKLVTWITIFLIVLAGYTHWTVAVFATKFRNTTNDSSSSGFYSFYDENTLVACYPIDKTIISSIEEVED
jgi:hypothetical protein